MARVRSLLACISLTTLAACETVPPAEFAEIGRSQSPVRFELPEFSETDASFEQLPDPRRGATVSVAEYNNDQAYALVYHQRAGTERVWDQLSVSESVRSIIRDDLSVSFPGTSGSIGPRNAYSYQMFKINEFPTESCFGFVRAGNTSSLDEWSRATTLIRGIYCGRTGELSPTDVEEKLDGLVVGNL
ncbi:MAG: hypothetical protein ACFB6S_04970 [Geminicoccaceae bacterium]